MEYHCIFIVYVETVIIIICINTQFKMTNKKQHSPPPLWLSLLPLVFLSISFGVILSVWGMDYIAVFSSVALLASALMCVAASALSGRFSRGAIAGGIRKSASQVLPAVPLLILIALISSVWMLSGVVPAMIHYGLSIISPSMFPVLAFAICAGVSMVSGSSWTTIGTIGVAFIGIGGALGYGMGWTAGAIISGAYLGDKVSPLSDTTVVAASSCGVDTLKHVRYMLGLTWPAIVITAIVYIAVGLLHDGGMTDNSVEEIRGALNSVFGISGWLLIIPLITGIMIALRIKTIITLGLSVLIGLVSIFLFQPQIAEMLGGVGAVFKVLWSGAEIEAGSAQLQALTSTSGFIGMLPTISLVLSAMIFGGLMLGTGMLETITKALTRRIKGPITTVSATTGSGLLLVACTSDQYLSLIVGGNMYKRHYEKHDMPPCLLSSTLESGVTVTSPLLPWSSCGLAHAAVLDVSALVYAPFALFCWLSPAITILLVKIRSKRRTLQCA